MLGICWCQNAYDRRNARVDALRQQLQMYKDAHALLKLHDDLNNINPPCEWKNSNICVAEGCFGEACLKMDLRKDQK